MSNNRATLEPLIDDVAAEKSQKTLTPTATAAVANGHI